MPKKQLTKEEALKKYLSNPLKKKKKRQKKTAPVMQNVQNVKVFSNSENFGFVGAGSTQQIEEYQEDEVPQEEDEMPLVVETEESAKLTAEEKERALKSITPFSLRDSQKDKYDDEMIHEPSQTFQKGKWEKESVPKLNQDTSVRVEQENKDYDSDEEEDPSSSEEIDEDERHDSIDSDLDDEDAEEEAKKDLNERNKDFQQKIANALGVEVSKENLNNNQIESDSDSDLDDGDDSDSSSLEGDPKELSLTQKLELLKQQEEALKLKAEEYKNAPTNLIEKGKRVKVEDLRESKRLKIEKWNKKIMKEWSQGYRQFIEKKEQKEREQRQGQGESTIEAENALLREIDQMKNNHAMEDPLGDFLGKRQINQEVDQWRMTVPCRFPGTSNRYGIKPGYMWDGVDRGNGYEKRFLAKMNEAEYGEDDKYLEHARHL